MKEIFYIKDTLANKVTYFHLLAFLLMLPFDMFYSECILVSLTVHTCIHLTSASFRRLHFGTFLPSLIFLVSILFTLNSRDYPQASKDLEKQLALLLIPLIFGLTTIDIKLYRDRLLKAFTFCCTAVVCYLYFDAFRVIHYTGVSLSALTSSAFTNHNFSLPIDLHATYLSAFLSLSLCVALVRIIRATGPAARIIYLFCSVMLSAGIFQLSSRGVFLASIVIVNVVVPVMCSKRSYLVKYLLVVSIATSLTIGLVFSISSYRERFLTELRQELLTNNSVRETTEEQRMLRWHSALTLIRKSPIFGYGTGSEGKILTERYFIDGLYNSYLNQLNAHNQYLSFMLKSGVIGILVYLLVLYTGFKSSFASRDVEAVAFLLIISIISFSENILDVNKGIFFFGFFYSLLPGIALAHVAWPLSLQKKFRLKVSHEL